jgi:hypothetical protein
MGRSNDARRAAACVTRRKVMECLAFGEEVAERGADV